MKRILSFALLFASVFAARADFQPPAKEKFLIVALAGQSNMAGRGIPAEADKVAHPRVVMMNRQGEWVPCVDPIHFDVDNSGVGPGKTFAEALAESDPSITVGVVPCAVGGCPLTGWEPGAMVHKGKTDWHPYDDCVERVRKAQQVGTLAAILWHQGESDCKRGGGYVYQARFPVLVQRLREDLHAEGVPLICGSLFPELARGWFGKIQCDTQRWTCEYAYGPGKFVMCPEDCERNSDNIHFTRDSQVKFGKLYFAAYQEVVKALAGDKDYWRNPESDAAKIQPKAIPDWKADDAERQIGAVPEKLPDAVEKWLFPKGRPVKE